MTTTWYSKTQTDVLLAGRDPAGAAAGVQNAVNAALAAKADLVAGVIPTSQLPSISLENSVVVANRAAMLALTAAQVQPGDIAVDTSTGSTRGSYILTAADPSLIGSWLLLNAPLDAVQSVNGQSGTVVLSAANVGADAAGAAAAATINLPVNVMSASGTAVIGARNAVNASAGPVAVALPTPTAVGQHIIIERSDASAVAANAITITGTIRGTPGTVVTLAAVGVANEGGHYIAESLTSWAIAGSIKPKAVLDAYYASLASPAFTGTPTIGGIPVATQSPTDTGYDLVLLLGQSNMVGQGTADSKIDVTSPRVFQYAGSGTYTATISQAIDPLAHQAQADGLGPGTTFARWYADAAPTNRRVLLVPAAWDGTPFDGADSFAGAHSWKITTTDNGNNLYKNALRQAQGALTAAGPNARVVAALWLQGETDAFNGTSGPTYQADLLALIDQLRTDLGNATLPFVIAQMLPDRIATTPVFATIDTVHAAIPGLRTKTAYAYSPFGLTQGDNLHFSPAGQRVIGRNLFQAYLSAVGTAALPAVPAQVTGVTASSSAATTATVSWSAATRATSYYVEYKATASGTWLAGVGSSGSTATITGLTASTPYDFRVTARNASGSGTASATASVTTTSAANQAATLSVTSGMAAWYKPDVGVTTASGKVTAWADQSGQGNNLAQATGAAQPTYTATGLNGVPMLTFAGAQGLACSSGTGLAQTSTTFVVFQQVAGSSTYTLAVVGNVSGGIQYRLDIDQQHAVQSNTADIGYGTTHLTQGAPHIGALRMNSTTADFFKETGTDGTATHAAMTFVNTGIQVGWQGSAQPFNGMIGEVIVYGRALTDTEVTTVRQYLGNRYGITVS